MTSLTREEGEVKMRAVEVGDLAPDFMAQDLQGNTIGLKSLTGGRKTLLIFYRGSWCPFCNEQLGSIAQDYSKFLEKGTVIVAVSSEQVEKGREFHGKLKLPFAVLSDTAFEGIDRFGIRDSNPSEKTRAKGITQLSRPATFVIDASGIIRYRYIGKNASDRPKNEDLLKALDEAGVDACELPRVGN